MNIASFSLSRELASVQLCNLAILSPGRKDEESGKIKILHCLNYLHTMLLLLQQAEHTIFQGKVKKRSGLFVGLNCGYFTNGLTAVNKIMEWTYYCVIN